MIILLATLFAGYRHAPRHRLGILTVHDLPGIHPHLHYRAGASHRKHT